MARKCFQIDTLLHASKEIEKENATTKKRKRKSHGKRKRGGKKSTSASTTTSVPSGSRVDDELDVFKRQVMC